MQTAKQLQKVKHIKKVKAAIRYNEQLKKRRAPLIKEAIERKQAVLRREGWYANYPRADIKTSLKNAREDWKLGPLRPNRAVGEDAGRYGALNRQQVRAPEIPVHMQQKRNETRKKQGRDVEYPLVCEGKKYFPIAKDDRVVIIRGREKDKIGTVLNITEETHEVTIKDLNKQYIDSRVFSYVAGQDSALKREYEMSIPLSDIRLVLPYRVTTYTNGQPRTIEEDVIVDNIVMERHTTGIDPFTGVDYGTEEIPKEHQYDPETGEPIFHRYITGTRHRIEWPWERPAKFSEDTKAEVKENQDWQAKLRARLGKSVSFRLPFSNKTEVDKTEAEKAEAERAKSQQQLEDETIPRGKPVRAAPEADIDTTRNKVEDVQNFVPSLVEPPHPTSVASELNLYALDRPSRREVVERQLQRKEEAVQARQELLDTMKTPMQLRWELEHARKQAEGAKMSVSTDMLLAALGKHMQNNGVQLTESRRKAASKMAHLD